MESKPGGDSFTAARPGIIATIYLSPNKNQHENLPDLGFEAALHHRGKPAPPIQTPCLSLFFCPHGPLVLYSFRAKALPLLMAAERSELPYELVFFS